MGAGSATLPKHKASRLQRDGFDFFPIHPYNSVLRDLKSPRYLPGVLCNQVTPRTDNFLKSISIYRFFSFLCLSA